MTREELIAALEVATGPAFVLDEAITRWRYADAGLPPSAIPIPYTASIDAALTLVPEGWAWVLDGDGRAALFDGDGRAEAIQAATPSLALCAAALRAAA